MSLSAQPAPVIPPRPTRSQTKGDAPPVPPRPAGRSKSPNPHRFAPSPLNDNLLAKNSQTLTLSDDASPPRQPKSVVTPSACEDSMEYSVPEELLKRSVGDDIRLAAPDPRLPSSTARDRVSMLTRPDSEPAASYSFGKPASQTSSLKEKASTSSQISGFDVPEDKDGMPEIGQRIPLLAHAGDVQAPSPALGSADGVRPRHHSRRTSARSFVDLPEDSYGLRGHGKAPKDKLDMQYYHKHPEVMHREKQLQRHEHDRASDFAMTSEELNKLVRESAAKAEDEPEGIPSENIGYEAHVEYASRMSLPNSTVPTKIGETEKDPQAIHVKQDSRGQFSPPIGNEDTYQAPILAPDEVARDAQPYEQAPAVAPPPERSGSAFEIEQPKSRPSSRSSSMYVSPIEGQPTSLECVQDYEPLFPEDGKEPKPVEPQDMSQQRFPSKDIWEDAPSSVHVTAEVSELQPRDDSNSPLEEPKPDSAEKSPSVQAAEEQNGHRGWVQKQLNTSNGKTEAGPQIFPSHEVRGIEPDGLKLEATVSAPQQTEQEKASPTEIAKPPIPARPTRMATEGTTAEAQEPVVSERPKAKPAVPHKPKPALLGRPVGVKIAALQAGFMADLNKRLQVGPNTLEKENPISNDLLEEKEKVPLSDARKSRARGPKRRVPGSFKSSAPGSGKKPSLNLSAPRTLWCIEPQQGSLSFNGENEDIKQELKLSASSYAVEEPVSNVKI